MKCIKYVSDGHTVIRTMKAYIFGFSQPTDNKNITIAT